MVFDATQSVKTSCQVRTGEDTRAYIRIIFPLEELFLCRRFLSTLLRSLRSWWFARCGRRMRLRWVARGGRGRSARRVVRGGDGLAKKEHPTRRESCVR